MAAAATLPALLDTLTQSLSSALETAPKIAAIEQPKDGISLLDVKNELLLSYLQNLVFLILLKLRNSKSSKNSSEDGHDDIDESVRAKLVELRLYLEKGARPLEEKLRFSIERFLRTAQDSEREKAAREKAMNAEKEDGSDSEAASDDESDQESEEGAPVKPGNRSAAPNLGTMVDDVTARPAQRESAPSGVYRPPKRERQVMETTRREKSERRPMKSRTMEEFINSELSSAPVAEPSVGTNIVQGGRKMKTVQERKDEDERREYEEMHFTRLPKESKKDRAKKAKQTGRDSRMTFGGEEWHDLGEGVDRIDRLTRRKESRGGVRALLDKSRKRGHDATDGPRGSGHGPEIGERYQKKLKMLQTGRRDRGNKRKFLQSDPTIELRCTSDSHESPSHSTHWQNQYSNMEDADKMDIVADGDAAKSSTIDEEDDDPITATYNVFLNPALPHGRRLLVMQHPNRTDKYPRPAPTELRLKARSGMVEVDVPVDHSVAYDREKGLKWGRTLQASMAAKNGGSHGLAGGFGFGAVQQRGGKKRGEEDEDAHLDWNEAMRQHKVLTTQTLGGQYPDADEVQYMVGVFQGMDLHLTPVSSLVHLRPQLHHIDATAQLERQAAAGASKDAAPSSATTGARAIHMTIKTTADGDSVPIETMADRLRSVQTEQWRRMRYTDENEESAWDVYNDSLFLKPAQETPESDDKSDDKKDDKKDAETAAVQPSLEDSVPRFATQWVEDDLLEAVSGIKKPDPAPIPEPPKLKVKEEAKAPRLAAAEEQVASRPRATRTRGGAAAAAAARRGGRAKAGGASRPTAD
ncbi:Sin-like protein conserved region-domain-containing protein [Stachybotrys elegans]|uniref:Sin-like protein conserved region-domain-containing protein n=1 Tax=Stachybotrys elegans TaxID=80388 RepID=A0A8K0SRY6_9HYPO|nr:Sin-like protein conserved region-domain-containing protein [Stachybotrys elegans]